LLIWKIQYIEDLYEKYIIKEVINRNVYVSVFSFLLVEVWTVAVVAHKYIYYPCQLLFLHAHSLASGPLDATSSSTLTIWLKDFRVQVQKYGVLGDAIYKGVRYITSAHDFTPDVYDTTAPFPLLTPRALTSKGLEAFQREIPMTPLVVPTTDF
jgi:hypothetical protein